MGGVEAQGAAVEPGQVGALGRVHADAGQAGLHGVQQIVAVGLQVAQQGLEPGAAVGQGGQGGFQAQGADAVHHAGAGIVEGQAGGRVLDDGEAGLHPGDVVGLAGRHQGDGTPGDFRAQGGGGDVPAAVEAQLGMDLVGNDQRALVQAGSGHRQQFVPGEDLAQGVVRVAQEHRAGALQGLAQGVHGGVVGAVDGELERHFDLVQAPVARGQAQGAIVGGLQHHLLLRLDEGVQGHVEPGLDPGEENQLVGPDAPGVFVPQVGDHRLAQFVPGHAIAQQRVLQTLAQGLEDAIGHGEIHVRHPHRQDILGVAAPFGAAGAMTGVQGIEIEAHERISSGRGGERN